MAETLDPVPPRVKALIALFDQELAGLKFPDVDRDILLAHVDEVKAKAAEVAKAEAALAAVKATLDEAQERLNAKAYRAQGYARVFAEGNDALVDKLDAIALSKSRGPARPAQQAAVVDGGEPAKKRGRPAKAGGKVEKAAKGPVNLFNAPAEITPVLETASEEEIARSREPPPDEAQAAE